MTPPNAHTPGLGVSGGGSGRAYPLRMRRILFWSAAGAAVVALITVTAVLIFDSDDASDVSEATSTTGGEDPAGTEEREITTTTAAEAPIESVGAAPVDGAILSEPVEGPVNQVDVGEETDCSALEDDFEPVACSRVQGSGGHFLVFVGRDDGGGLRSSLYRASDTGSTSFTPVAQSKTFEADVEVFEMSLAEFEVGGEPVVIIDYDFNGSGSVHSFDVVAWDETDEAPRVVAFVGGTGGDRFHPEDDALQFVSANYDDGAPTCCPNFADVRTLRRSAPGEWDLSTETVPFNEAP